jgi:1-deoxy-D-xylulose-5-phosphate synthase
MFLAAGSLVRACLKAADLLECEGLSVGVADARWVKPLDGALLDALASVPLVTVEENTLMGGFGSAVLEYYESSGRLSDVRIRRAGLPDLFGEHATRAQQLAEHGLDCRALAEAARAFVAAAPTAAERVLQR